MSSSNIKPLLDPVDIDSTNLQTHYAELNVANRKLQSRLDELELFVQINSSLSLVLDYKETLDTIRQFFLAHFNLESFALVLKEETLEMKVRACFGRNTLEGQIVEYNSDTFFYKETFEQRKTVYCRDLSKLDHCLKGFDSAQGSLLVVPIVNKIMGFMGLLFLKRPLSDAFTESEIDFIKRIGDHVASVMTRVLIHQKTKNLAFTDELTGVFNRRYFNQRYAREIGRAKRYNRRLSALMIDIDHFKQYNDTLGHIMGDQVLRQMAEIFENNIRKADVISRYGGEEFVIILPEIDAARAVVVAEKLRTVVENSNFPGIEKLPAGKITISIGVASFPQDGSAPAEVLNEADKALYVAKKMGRNRVVDSSLLKEMHMQ